MCSKQLVWCAHLTSSWGISFCFGVQSFRSTHSAPGYCEPCGRFVLVRVSGCRSHFQWGILDFPANRRSSHVYFRGLVLICMLWELAWVFWNDFLCCIGPIGDVPGRSWTGDVSTEVETCASFQEACGSYPVLDCACWWPGRPSHSGVPLLERSRELLEQAFHNGMAVFQYVYFEYCSHWFHVYKIACIRPTQCWSWRYCYPRNWTPACYAFQVGSADTKLVPSSFYSAGCSVLDFQCTFRVCRTWRRIGQASAKAFSTCKACNRNHRHQWRRKRHQPQKEKGPSKKRLEKRRRLERPMSLRGNMWMVRQILWRSPVIFTVNSVGVMGVCWLAGHLRFCGTITVQNIWPWTSDCV